MSASEEMLEFLTWLHDEAQAFASRQSFDGAFEKDGVVVCLYCTLIEYTGAFVRLLSSGTATGMPPIFRSFLEAYVDFSNAASDPEYVNVMKYEYHYEWIRILKNAGKDNPYLGLIGKSESYAERLAEHKAELLALKKRGTKKLNKKEKFDKIGMSQEYESIYAFVCGQVHNNLHSVFSRHLRLEDNAYEITLYNDFKLDGSAAEMDAIGSLLVTATKTLNLRLGNADAKFVETLKDRLNNVRSAK